jgi:hypothetical protein
LANAVGEVEGGRDVDDQAAAIDAGEGVRVVGDVEAQELEEGFVGFRIVRVLECDWEPFGLAGDVFVLEERLALETLL